MKRLKVINIVEEGRYGGPQKMIVDVTEKLKEYNIETIVIFPKKDSVFFFNKLTEKGVQARRIRLHRLTKQKSHFVKYVFFFIPELFALYNLIKKNRVDIVHCHSSYQIKGVIAGKLAKANVIWHLHDTLSPAFIRFIFKYLALHFCDAFITAGERVRSYYLSDEKLSRKKIDVIQSPTDISIFDPNKVEKNEKIVQCQGLRIITVGNLNPVKGIEYFIEMASILNSRYDTLDFFIIGSFLDSQREYSKKLHEMTERLKIKNVVFYGLSDNVPSVLKAADIYVCSSIAEASPISVWEAMSMAKAIVATDVGDVAKFIRNSENGFVVPVKDSAALAEKVSMLIENKELRRKFGQRARETAVKHLDIEICAKKHVQLYREIMNN